MSKIKEFYVILSSVLKPKIATTKSSCYYYKKKYENTQIHTFLSEEEAKNFAMSFDLKISQKLPNDFDNFPIMKPLNRIRDRKIASEIANPAIESQIEDYLLPTIEEVDSHDKTQEFNDLLLKKFIDDNKDVEKINPKVEVERKMAVDDKKIDDEPAKKGFDYYFFYAEDARKMDLASKKINSNNNYHLFFDGASKGNPGAASVGYHITSADADKIISNSLFIGIKTNNAAEYLALIYGLRTASNLGIKNLSVYGDSKLIINQVAGDYKIKSPQLYGYWKEANKGTKLFDKIELKHIDREYNTIADKLANAAMTKRFTL